MPKKLTYFELNGLAEVIRYIFHYTGQKFEDVRLNYAVWSIKEVKDKAPFSKLPLLEEEDGRVLHQSIAIARYAAANTELLPSDPWEQAVLDAAVLTVYDFDKRGLASAVRDVDIRQDAAAHILTVSMDKKGLATFCCRYPTADSTPGCKIEPDIQQYFVNWHHEDDAVKKAEFKKKFYDEHLDFYFSRFEKQLTQNNGHFGKKLSWADFVFVGIIECVNLFFDDNVEKNYPHITALMKEVQNSPGVKDYIKNRKPYDVSCYL